MQLKSVDEIIKHSVCNGLYLQMIRQLNKDFESIIDKAIPENTEPNQLKRILSENLEYLLKSDVAAYQNLLYKIDVSEKKITSITTETIDEYVELVTLLVLQREWQKVWFRNKL
ncbi:hypothetical protein [Pseudofulvibacter geojedonensis]|uniref:Uncharacterized protein n=1 Tax=Pseudofulvibacter geojedonensis TaxID=1123758 RepID=A0ABW3I6A4_9FLAO